MPETTNVEILVGKAAATPGASMRSSSATVKPSDGEALGHQSTPRIMRCQNCGALSYVDYDPTYAGEYRCAFCSAGNIL